MTTGTLQDASIGYKAESVYGTPVVVDRFVEFVDESFEWDPKRVQGQGIRAGSKVARSARRVTTQTSAKGDMTVEMTSKGLGTLLAACMGAGASTLVAGTTYQQLFTLATGPNPPSLTVQKAVPRIDGTLDPYTFNGGVVESFELDCPQGEIVTLKPSFIFREVLTATAYATPSYVATPSLFHFAQGRHHSGRDCHSPYDDSACLRWHSGSERARLQPEGRPQTDRRQVQLRRCREDGAPDVWVA